MTIQVHDRFMLRGEEYVVLGRQGDIRAPSALGVRTRLRPPTSCIRGWHAVWASDGEGIVLHDLFVYPEGDPPDIRGVAAAHVPDDASARVYRSLDVPCVADVRFVLGRGYGNGDFSGRFGRSPCVFTTVVELAFSGNKRVLERDHSAAVKVIRDRVNALKALEIPPGWGADSRKALADLQWSFTTNPESLTD